MAHKAPVLTFAACLAGSVAAEPTVATPAEADGAYPVVLTPTRLRQSLQDVPASVTIVTADMLNRYGVTDLAEALRLVPGMLITQPSGNDYRIIYHGTNMLTPRRMNVLIDGVSVYQPAFARVDWKNLPVAIEDIDRIEVTRGPNSAAYGPNSMLGVVNIITKHPSDVERGLVSMIAGSRGLLGATARIAGSIGDTSLRLTVSKERDSGYDFVSRIGSGHDSTNLDRINLRTQTRFGLDTTFDVNAGYIRGIKEIPFVEQYQVTQPDQRIEGAFLAGTLLKTFSPTHQLQVRATYWSTSVRQPWQSCPPTALFLPEMAALWQANPAYATAIIGGRTPSGGTPSDNALAAAAVGAIRRLGAAATQPTCGSTNQDVDERRTALELQDTFVASDRLRLVAGLGVRHQQGRSETYLGGAYSNSIWWAFGNVEYKPRDWLSLNAGGYGERDDLSGGTSISPRVAANVRLSKNQSARFVFSTGTRAPDVLEQRANWSYTLRDATPPFNGSTTPRFFQSARSPGGLTSERIVSREIGYLWNEPSLGLLLDAKVFDDRLSHLISEKLQVSSFLPTNNGSVRLTGFELQANMALSTSSTAFANYTYLLNRDASNPTEVTQYSKNSGSLGVSHRFGDGWTMSLAYYGASGDGVGQSSYGREDLILSKAIRAGTTSISTTLGVRRLDNPRVSYYRDVGSIAESSYDNRLQVFGQVKVGF